MLLKYNTFFSLVVIAMAAGGLNTNCYTSGISGDCSPYIKTFCSSIGFANTKVAAFDTASRCFNTNTGTKCDFTAWNVNPGPLTQPSLANCEAALTSVASTCPKGGSGMFSKATFQFSLDPNTGRCGPPAGNS
ncbi:hypothetical protein C8J56DRAFT_1041849 [Mycena floridula]|nr:hypothetical protein C8J56DRAFT_1041849 [Mycena floridula]